MLLSYISLKSTSILSIKVTFTIEGDSMFAIQGDNTVVAKAIFDYESQSEYSIKVVATDDEGLFTKQELAIMVC